MCLLLFLVLQSDAGDVTDGLPPFAVTGLPTNELPFFNRLSDDCLGSLLSEDADDDERCDDCECGTYADSDCKRLLSR